MTDSAHASGDTGWEAGDRAQGRPEHYDASVLLARAPAVSGVQSGPLDRDFVRATADQLFERVDPLSESGAAALSKRRLPHVYPRSILGAMDKRFAAVVHNRECAYICGAQPRVGVTSFLADYARAFNYRAATMRDPRRIAYVQLLSGSSSGTKFLDDLATGVRTSLGNTELRFRGTGHMVDRILGTLRLYRVSVLILDHVHLLPVAARNIIADVVRRAEPEHIAPYEVDEYSGLQPRLGVVLAGNKRADLVFNSPGEILPDLLHDELVYPSYRTAEDVADALRKSDIGLEDFDSSQYEDALMAQYVLEVTQGRIDLISSLLQVVDWIKRANRAPRPTLQLFVAAAPLNRSLRESRIGRPEPAPDRLGWDNVEVRAQAYMQGEPVPLRTSGDSGPVTESRSSRHGQSGRRPTPKEVHDGREHAEQQRRKMTGQRRTRERKQ